MEKFFRVKVINSNALDTDRLYREILKAETRMNDNNILRFHIEDANDNWIKIIDNKPEYGKQLLGYNIEWIDDYSPDGINTCYLQEGEPDYWMISKWCNTHDEWHTRSTDKEFKSGIDNAFDGKTIEAPTHWRYKPEPPKD